MTQNPWNAHDATATADDWNSVLSEGLAVKLQAEWSHDRYKGTSPIRKCSLPWDPPMTLGIGLL